MTQIALRVNAQLQHIDVEPRRTLADTLRHDLGMYGVHLGCEHGVCGACTVAMDGRLVLSCLTLAVQADGSEIRTVEGVASGAELSAVQVGFNLEHGLQCGFCTPGFIVATTDLLDHHPDPDESLIRRYLSGNLCRCTGYTNIVRAVKMAARLRREGRR